MVTQVRAEDVKWPRKARLPKLLKCLDRSKNKSMIFNATQTLGNAFRPMAKLRRGGDRVVTDMRGKTPSGRKLRARRYGGIESIMTKDG